MRLEGVLIPGSLGTQRSETGEHRKRLAEVDCMFYSVCMARAQYTEIHGKSALNRVQEMLFAWFLNP